MSLFKQDKVFYKKLLTIALPISIQGLIGCSLPIIDSLFLGTLGQNEIAAVTLATSPFITFVIICCGFQSGAGVLINQYFGKGDLKAVDRIVGITFMAAFGLTFVMGVLALCFPMQIMSIYTPDPEMQALASEYMKIVAFSYAINIFSQTYTTAHRCMGNAKIGAFITAVAMVSNVFFNWVFIFGKLGAPALGIAGAALGTLIARIIEFCVAFIHNKLNDFYRINVKEAVRPGKVIMFSFFKYVGPILVNETFWGSGYSLLPALYTRYGGFLVAAYTIAGNVERIVMVFSRSVADAAGVMVGAELGANNLEKAKKYTVTLFAIATASGAVLACIMYFFIPSIVSMFKLEAETVELAQLILALYVLKMPLSMFNYTAVVGILRCGGDAKGSAVIDSSCMWFFSVLGTAIVVFIIKPDNPIFVFFPLLIDEFLKCILSLIRLKQGHWIQNITVELN